MNPDRVHMLILGTFATGPNTPPLVMFTSDPIGSYATTQRTA